MPPVGLLVCTRNSQRKKVVAVVFLLDVFWTFEDGGRHVLRGRCLTDLLCED